MPCSRKAQNTALSNVSYYTHIPFVLQPFGRICVLYRICALHPQRNASSVRCSRRRQHPNQKTAFSCGNRPVRKAFFIFQTWQTHCHPVDYVIVIQSSCEHQCVQLTAMLLAAEPGVDAGRVDIAVPQNNRQMLQIMLCPIEAHSEQVPKIVGEKPSPAQPGLRRTAASSVDRWRIG